MLGSNAGRNLSMLDEAGITGSMIIGMKIGRKIRDSEVKKCLSCLLVGEKSKKTETFCAKSNGEGDLGNFSLEEVYCPILMDIYRLKSLQL